MGKPSYVAILLLLWCGAIAQAQLLQTGFTWTIGQLQLTFHDLDVVRVVFCPTSGCAPKTSLVVIAEPHIPTGERIVASQPADDIVEISSSKLSVVVNSTSYRVTFKSSDGDVILSEPVEDAKVLLPREDLGLATYKIRQSFLSPDTEALYGLGQYMNGMLNYKNTPITLQQFNTEIAIPFYISTQGYGILWDNYAKTIFNAAPTEIPLKHQEKSDADLPQEDSLAHFYIPEGMRRGALHEVPLLLGSTFTPPTTGTYHFLAHASNGWGLWNPELEVKLNDTIAISYKGSTNMPATMSGRAFLTANVQYNVSFSCSGCDATALTVIYPTNAQTTIESEVGDLIDYYFIAAPSMDGVIAKYRQLTGPAPMYPKPAFGFWQCREHYESQQELLAAAHQFRARGVPMDNMVQDWQYWYPDEWMSEWDISRYPDPAGMVQELASINATIMLSVWSRYEYSKVVDMMQRDHLFIPDSKWFDPTNPLARDRFYLLAKLLAFNVGIPALWLDATEPEDWPHKDKMLAAGSGNRFFNTFSLQVTQAIYEGWSRDYPDRRFFALTRSSFAGQQRYAAAIWSGDILATWETLQRQVPAGINFAMSGMPYWTTDVGGFVRPNDQYDSAAYHELLIRWFQFGAFCPLFRVHGAGSHTEIWNYGEATSNAIQVSHKLRYRLLPYIYSLAGAVTMQGYTIMRGLVLDFTQDVNAREIPDQFMFGPAIMVAPVTHANATTRNVYLPIDPQNKAGQHWYDFWSGEVLPANRTVHHALDNIAEAPLFIRGGSIVLMGPHLQYTAEKPADPIEVRVYPGRSCDFLLYEDDGHTNAYRNDAYTIIKFSWNQTAQVLTIGARQGSFPQMLKTRTFNVVFVNAEHGTGLEPATPDATVQYDGKAHTVAAPTTPWAEPLLRENGCVSRACRMAARQGISSA